MSSGSNTTLQQTGEGHPLLDSTPQFKALVGAAISRPFWFFMLHGSTTASSSSVVIGALQKTQVLVQVN